MKDQLTEDYTVIVFGALFLIGGLVMVLRAWRVGHRWRVSDQFATAQEIEGAANLRYGMMGVIGGGSITAGGILLAVSSPAAMNGFAGGVAFVTLLDALVAVALLLNSGMKLNRRASNVRVRDSLPKRPRLYLVWPPPPPSDGSSLN